MTGGLPVPEGVQVSQASKESGSAQPQAVRPTFRSAAVGVLVASALAVVAIDLLTKQLALSHLADRQPLRILGGLVYLDVTRNSGAAFSLGGSFTAIFPIIALVVVAGIVWLSRTLRSIPWAISLGLILGGAFGNMGDRLFRAPGPFVGHVVDFISVFGPNAQYFPIFNAADSALSVGVVLAILLELAGRRRDGTRLQRQPGVPHSAS
jgi:signal peptidase II